MNKYFGFRWFLFLPLFISCSKGWLDEKTDQSLTVPSSIRDLQALLDNSTVMNYNSPALGEVASGMYYISDMSWQNLSSDAERNAYEWTHDRLNLQVSDWNNPYTKIFYSNVVLEALQKISPDVSSRTEIDNIKGNALFHRSKNFFELTQIYAPLYDSTTAFTDLGIPLKLESDINVKTARATVKQDYDQIIGDLLLAKDLVSNIPLYKTRASKPAVFALLARIYLCMKNYPKALLYSDSCLKMTSKLLDYNSLDSTLNYPIAIFNDEVIFHSTMVLYFSFFKSNLIADSTLIASYSADDLRQSVCFSSSSGHTTFKGSYYGGSLFFNGLATDEMYLIRAESSARIGNTSDAISDLNQLMVNRWRSGKFVPFSVSNTTDLLAQILIERKKELLYRGLWWSDLRRLNQDSRFSVTLSRTVNGSTYSIAPNSYKYTFAIPDDILKQTGIQQNTGW